MLLTFWNHELILNSEIIEIPSVFSRFFEDRTNGMHPKVLFLLHILKLLEIIKSFFLILAYTCDKNASEHRRRQTSGMKFPSACALYESTRTLIAKAISREQTRQNIEGCRSRVGSHQRVPIATITG